MISTDPRTRDSIWMAVAQALSCLADPAVLDAVSPEPGEEFDPRDFLTQNGTLYLLATGAGAGASWPLVAAFIEDLTETARHLAAASSGARLDPPLLMALDEIGNLAPLPSLPVLMAEGGGTGITTMPVLQSLSQARDKWGDHAASTIWDASIVKVILGGASARDLQELSVLIGERDERTDTISVGDYGSRSLQRSTRRVPVMPPESIRTLPFGTGLVLLRSAPPIVTNLRRWTPLVARRGAAAFHPDRRRVKLQIRHRGRPLVRTPYRPPAKVQFRAGPWRGCLGARGNVVLNSATLHAPSSPARVVSIIVPTWITTGFLLSRSQLSSASADSAILKRVRRGTLPDVANVGRVSVRADHLELVERARLAQRSRRPR